MLRSLSFRQKPTPSLSKEALKDLQQKIVANPEPADVLLFLKHVQPDRVLLVVPEGASKDKVAYVKSERAERLSMIRSDPTLSMRALQTLFKRMLPAKAEVAPEVWAAAKPLKRLLGSDEVKNHGVRHTQALTEALSVLGRARQAQLDRQGVGLEPAPTGKEEASDPLEVVLEMSLVLQGGAPAASDVDAQPARPSPVSHTSPPKPDADDATASPDTPKRSLVRRAKSAQLNRSNSLWPKDGPKH